MNPQNRSTGNLENPRRVFLISVVCFLGGDILGIESNILLLGGILTLIAGISGLWYRNWWISLFFILVTCVGFQLGKTGYEKGLLEYAQLKEMTDSFSKKGIISGDIVGIAYRKERSIVYRFKIDNFDNFDKNSGKLIEKPKPYVEESKGSPHVTSLFIEIPSNLSLRSGDRIEFTGTIRSNISFPLLKYDRYAFFKGGYGYIFVPHFSFIKKTQPGLMERLKLRWEGIFHAGFPRNIAGMSLGMTIGSTKYLTEEVKDAFLLSGITHILVVSGANIAFLIVLITFFTRYIGFKEWINTAIVALLVVLYVAIVGFEVPVIRAAIMGILSYYVASSGRKFSGRALLAATLIFLTLLEPLSPLYDAGYGLSFGATLGIILFEGHTNTFFQKLHIPGSIRTIISLTLGATLGSLPIILYHFSQIPISSILTNVIIGGFLGWILFSSTLYGIFSLINLPLLKYFGLLVYIPIGMVIKISEFFSYGYIFALSKEIGTALSVFMLGIIMYFFIFDEEARLYPK